MSKLAISEPPVSWVGPISLDAGDVVRGIDPLLLTCTPINTFSGESALTSATGFFLSRGQRLFLVTSRHVFSEPAEKHFPDRITIELHVNREDMAESTTVSIPLYAEGLSLWRQATDSAGDVDVALIEVDQSMLPAEAVYCAFTPEHIAADKELIEVGASLLVIGFPLGFHDALHHMPVVRRAALASAFGLPSACDSRAWGTSSPMHALTVAAAARRWSFGWANHPAAPALSSCRLLGVHSSRLDMATRDPIEDEALGLNCAWYSDVLLTLSED